MEISQDDPRGLTITGGLPYFGGPGNNYVTHSIAEMIDKVRSRPGSKGLVTANGNYITKQSAGIYSTEPIDKQFSPKNPSIYQAEISSKQGPSFTEFASGKAVIETYTVIHDRDGPSFGIIFGRLEDDSRFIANTPKDIDLMLKMTTEDFLGVSGKVIRVKDINVFKPD
jgi:acetyl-CoA C-acetyltransferase